MKSLTLLYYNRLVSKLLKLVSLLFLNAFLCWEEFRVPTECSRSEDIDSIAVLKWHGSFGLIRCLAIFLSGLRFNKVFIVELFLR